MNTSESISPDKFGGDQLQFHAEHHYGPITSYQLDHATVTFITEQARLHVSYVSSSIVRVVLNNGPLPAMSEIVSVNMSNPPRSQVQATVTESDLYYTVSVGDISITVNKQSMAFTLYDLSQKSSSGEHRFVRNGKHVHCHGEIAESAQIYGLGETTGYLDKRGERKVLWNFDMYDPHLPDTDSLYESIPFLLHFDQGTAYGLFVDDPGRLVFDMRTNGDIVQVESQKTSMDLYFMMGPSLKDVVTQYSSLTGRAPLPPLWAIGYHQSRYSYMDEADVLKIAGTFREKQIPCDTLYLDIHYMDEYRVFTFDQERYPNPDKLMTDLREHGFRIVPIVDPGVKRDPEYAVYREGVDNEMFCSKLEGEIFTGTVWPGESAFPDFSSDRVAKWWGEQHRAYTQIGIAGIWNDMNEPSVFNETKTMDLDVIHNCNGDRKTHREVHNMYGFWMSKATYLGLKQLLNGERPFVVTRAGYSGIQKYAAVWTGDNRSYWEHLALSIPMMMNLGLSGVPFSGADIGGFSHHTNGELVARWTQLGVFSPFCRNHSAIDTIRQEPWMFGEQVESICRKYIELRYQLLPYWYSLFAEANRTGLPIIRPLVMEFPHDRETYSLSDQFMIGGQLLVAPVYRPNTTHRSVYLPEGNWYDFWTGERIEGGRHILAHAPLDVLPLYVREGSILPMMPVRQHTHNWTWEGLSLHAYVGNGASELKLYTDDALTFDYEQGKFNLKTVYLSPMEDGYSITIKQEKNGFVNLPESIDLHVHGLTFTPETVQLVDGSTTMKAKWSYDEQRRQLHVTLPATFTGHLHITR